MTLLLGIGFVAGAVTAVSPCVLPVLPVLLAGGASGRKPLRIIAGLIASFCVFTLFATWLLSRLGLPQDLLRNLAIAALFVLAATLLLPRLALILERPLAVFSRLRPKRAGGGVLLGVSLGLVFVPCAGPVLATLTAAAANERFGIRTISLMVAYAVGASVPMLLIAYGGRRAAAGLRRHAARVRLVSGALIAAVALALVLHVDDRLTRLNPGVLQSLQTRIEGSASARRELARIEGRHTTLRSTATATAAAGATAGLPDYGAAPAISASGAWINSPPLTIAGLRGKVVLVD